MKIVLFFRSFYCFAFHIIGLCCISNFCVLCEIRVKVNFFPYRHLVALAPFVKKDHTIYLSFSGALVINQVTICVNLFLEVFCLFVCLFYSSTLVLVTHYFNYCSLSSSFFFFQDYLHCSKYFAFLYAF